jgi:hypothetical protein
LSDLFTYPHAPGFKARETSAAAAEAMKSRAPLLREMALSVLRSSYVGKTADEVANMLGESVLSIRPRISELSRQGLIEDSGTRRRNDSGKSAIVWKVRA